MKFHFIFFCIFFMLKILKAKSIFNQFLPANDASYQSFKSIFSNHKNINAALSNDLDIGHSMRRNQLSDTDGPLNKIKTMFKIKIYYDIVHKPNGEIYFIPKDTNKNHYFIG